MKIAAAAAVVVALRVVAVRDVAAAAVVMALRVA